MFPKNQIAFKSEEKVVFKSSFDVSSIDSKTFASIPEFVPFTQKAVESEKSVVLPKFKLKKPIAPENEYV